MKKGWQHGKDIGLHKTFALVACQC